MSKVDDIETLAEYDSDDDAGLTEQTTKGTDTTTKAKDTYVGVHSSGFREFLLRPELLRAITDAGFEHPSEVQSQCIPQAILGSDVICQAKSGMGKTAVFVLSCLQQLEVPKDAEAEGEAAADAAAAATATPAAPKAATRNPVQCLVLAHTRELAFQIAKEFERFSKYVPSVKSAVFLGGIPERENIKTLREVQPSVVIGTPGRILSLIEAGHLKVESLKHFVLDECDKMLEELSMRSDVQRIFQKTPHEKQTMMFTATLSEEMRSVCKRFMHNPLEVLVTDGAKLTLHGLQQYVVDLQENEKNRKLVDLLDSLEFNQLVIFVKSVERAKELNRLLQDCNFPSIALYGGLPQEKRIELYRKFKDFQARILVGTDLLGRGIDVERVNVVINYDMPAEADTYLHRVGRAGRFGTKGLAVSFLTTDEEKEVLKAVEGRFGVSLAAMPETVDPTSYMGS
eukprot:CAMPEP_0170745738 /NCGR_PEP_ID=MMETSP0437-20130122/8447_1 /TAXON_ID=0 /ORGANISM="Sexangularia sp." /LENGTH=454 /DNA_ID=CAMNT_0011084465 /DNA_START=449 /DNA_END=1813 /DNA_ORIENTATION=-